ncbi:NAD(P)-binding domain-containing protein [Streptomyces sp. NPDC055025]
MRSTVGIIGAGAVGLSIGTALAASGMRERLLIASRTADQAGALAAARHTHPGTPEEAIAVGSAD